MFRVGKLAVSFPKYGKTDDPSSDIKNVPFAMFNIESKELEIHLFNADWSRKSEKEAKKFSRFLKNLLLTF